VELHERLYRTPFYDGDLAGVWRRSRQGNIVGVPVQLMGDADLLVHALVHASVVPQRCGLSWIVDVVSLLNHRASDGKTIDWTEFTRLAGQSRATLPVYVTCHYLKTKFDAAIPQTVIDELRRSATNAGPLQHLAVLDGLRCEPRHRRIQTILESSGWRSRAAIARALLVPPPAYLKATHPGIRTLPLALLYLTRPLRFIVRQARRIRNRVRNFIMPARAVGAVLRQIPAESHGGH
jgi:hypothetical protein